MAFPLELAPLALSVALTLLLAPLLIAVNFTDRANRAFAFLLILRGSGLLAFTLGLLAATPAEADFWFRLWPYALLPLPFAAVAFALVYPSSRHWLGKATPYATLALFAAGAALDVAYLLDHRLVWGASTPGPAIGDGVLFVFFNLTGLAFAGVSLLFVRDYLRAAPGPERSSILLVSLGFALVVLYDGAGSLVGGGFFAGEAAILQAALRLVPVAAAATLLVLHARKAAEPRERRHARWYVAALPVPILCALAVGLLAPGATRDALNTFFVGLWRLPQPILVTIALVHHRVFGFNLRLKWTIRQSTLGVVFIGVFFVVSELAATFLSGSLGPYLGIVVAGIVVLGLLPLQRFAERVATVAVPQAKPAAQLSGEERAALYREQVRVLWADGTLTKSDRLKLEGIRESLGLSHDDADRLEREVTEV